MGIIKRPALTEKSQAMQEKGQYTFVVELTANKIEIAKEVKKMYGVDVQDVRTMRQIGKVKSSLHVRKSLLDVLLRSRRQL